METKDGEHIVKDLNDEIVFNHDGIRNFPPSFDLFHTFPASCNIYILFESLLWSGRSATLIFADGRRPEIQRGNKGISWWKPLCNPRQWHMIGTCSQHCLRPGYVNTARQRNTTSQRHHVNVHEHIATRDHGYEEFGWVCRKWIIARLQLRRLTGGTNIDKRSTVNVNIQTTCCKRNYLPTRSGWCSLSWNYSTVA